MKVFLDINRRKAAVTTTSIAIIRAAAVPYPMATNANHMLKSILSKWSIYFWQCRQMAGVIYAAVGDILGQDTALILWE